MSLGINLASLKKKHYLIMLALAVAAVLVVWWPFFENQFIMWDDDFNIYENPIFRNGSWLNFWKEPYMGFYIPITYTIWNILSDLFGQNDPFSFKILNLSFHVLNGFLVFHFMRYLFDEFLRTPAEKGEPADQKRDLLCFAVSMLYLLHPLQVGAVAWHSGFRDLLSTSGTLICLLLILTGKDWKSLIFAILAFGMTLLSKPSSVYLPGVVLGLSFVLGKESRKRLVGFSIFCLVFAAFFVVVTRRVQSQFMIGLTPAPFLDRPFLIMDSFGFYIRQFFGGALSGDYGRTPGRVMDWGLWQDTQIWFWGFLAVLALVFWKYFRQGWVFLCLWIVPLSPTSGVVHFNFQRISTVADHYFQPAMPAMCFLFLYLLHRFQVGLLHRWAKPAVLALFAVGVFASGFATHTRLPAWKDSETFFHSMLEVNPYSHSANNYLGFFAYRRQDWPNAEKFFRAALASQPTSAIATGNLAYALIKQNRFADAHAVLKDRFHDPVFINDNMVHKHVIAMNYLADGIALANLGRIKEAFLATCSVFKFEPETKDSEEAARVLEKIRSALSPSNPNALSCPS